jgi:hypothetical protein
MIGISENAVLAFCAALRMDIVALQGPRPAPISVLFRTPARAPGTELVILGRTVDGSKPAMPVLIKHFLPAFLAAHAEAINELGTVGGFSSLSYLRLRLQWRVHLKNLAQSPQSGRKSRLRTR